jgi:NAD(P)-dependent dehydrogenase (short-subunit alcohol dehydrogenase family)
LTPDTGISRGSGLLAGKVAIVTGAGAGIGRAEAFELARHGAAVVVNDTGGSVAGGGSARGVADAVVDEMSALGYQAAANYTDISSWEGAATVASFAIDTFGAIDVLVNNAGILRTGGLLDLEEDDWDALFRVHSKGTYAMLRHVGRYWRTEYRAGKTRSGSVINTTSVAGLPGGIQGLEGYGAAKAAVASISVSASIVFSEFGARVNAIAPYGLTRMARASLGQPRVEPSFGTDFDPQNPTNNAPLVAWLGSDRSAHVNGQIFRVRGNTIEHYVPWRPNAASSTERSWTIETVEEAINADIFGTTARPPRPNPQTVDLLSQSDS